MKVWPVKHSPLLCQPERFIARSELQALIRNVTQNLVNIKDESGQFLLRLDDGRVIDTKGWAGWEWTHGVGLYGIYQYYQQTGDIEMRDIIDRWFADRFAEGATTKNVNTMAPFLTLAYRFEETGRMAYLPWLESWAEWAMYEMPRTEQGADNRSGFATGREWVPGYTKSSETTLPLCFCHGTTAGGKMTKRRCLYFTHL